MILKRFYLLIHALFIIPILIYYIYVLNSGSLNYHAHLYLISFIYMALFAWIIYTAVILEKNFFNPYIGYVIVYFLFNGAQAILILFNISYSDMFNLITDDLKLKTLLMSLIGILFFHLVYLILNRDFSSNTSSLMREENNKSFKITGILLLLVSFFPYWKYFFEVVENIRLYGYAQGAFSLDVPTAILKLKDIYYIAIFILITHSKKSKFQIFILIGLLLIPTVYLYFLGIRGDNAFLIFSLLWLISVRFNVSKKYKSLFIIALITLMSFIPFIAESREASSIQPDNIGKKVDVVETFIEIIKETGFSMNTIGYTIYFVENGYLDISYGIPYLLGAFYLLPIPFVSSLLDKDLELLGVKLSDLLDGGFGVGSSIIAESYVNFSYLGPIILMSVVSFFFVIFYKKAKSSTILLPILCAILPRFMFWVRSEFNSLFRNIFWYMIVTLFIYLIINTIISYNKREGKLVKLKR